MNKGSEVEKHSLGSGVPCITHKCVQCCIETRMPLSRCDMKRILNLGYPLKDFAIKTRKEWGLKNHSGRCVFLSDGGCKIYSNRPTGCQIYPLVYNEETRKAVVDRLCPYGFEFNVRKVDVRKLRSLLKRLEN